MALSIMKRIHMYSGVNMKIILCVSLMLLLLNGSFGDSEDPEKKECCFVRAGYQGVCHVTPGEGETCESILKYLNTPGTVGKSYCGGSKLRGGWKQTDCEPEAEE
jgi:hypothetical protein